MELVEGLRVGSLPDVGCDDGEGGAVALAEELAGALADAPELEPEPVLPELGAMMRRWVELNG